MIGVEGHLKKMFIAPLRLINETKFFIFLIRF